MKSCKRKLELEGGALMRARSGLEKYLVETLDLSKHSGTQEPFLSELCSSCSAGWRVALVIYFIFHNTVQSGGKVRRRTSTYHRGLRRIKISHFFKNNKMLKEWISFNRIYMS